MIPPADLAQLPGRSNPIYLEGRILPLTVAQARELDLRNGQIVQALVQSRGGDDLALLLRGKSLLLPSTAQTAQLQAGQSVVLQVVQTGPNALGLQAMQTQQAASAAAPFFSRLGSLLFRPPGQDQLANWMKPGVMEALLKGRPDLSAQWRGMQLSLGQLDTQSLAQAISRAVLSALGPESRLLRGLPALAEDPKQLLRRLIQALAREDKGQEGAAADSVQSLTQALDEIEAAQVQTAQAQAQKELMINLMLPFVDADPIELQFRRAPRKEGEDPPPLIVNVHSRSQDLGEVWLKTQLPGLDRVELTMWALREGVVHQARARSGELAAQLSEAGLALKSFQVIHGPRPQAGADWVPSGRGLVIDVRA
ncbi:MAG: hypothetical protein FJY42_07605 [Betaproteobacteria bacterium]|nr:hypothetical protein [Betaproteobacteria bacterium]